MQTAGFLSPIVSTRCLRVSCEMLSRAPGPEFTQRNTFCDGASRAADAECMNTKKEFK